MKLVKILFLLPCLLFCCLQVSAQSFDWTSTVYNFSAGTNNFAETGRAMAIDLNGNTYLAIRARDTVQVGTVLQAATDTAVLNYLVKYNLAGGVEWVRSFYSDNLLNEGFNIRDIETDTAGNVFATGDFTGMIQLDATTSFSTPVGSRDVFVAKWNSGGGLVWAVTGGGPGIRFSNSLALHPGGNIKIGGGYLVTAGFGNTTLTSANSNTNAFVATVSAPGDFLDAQSALNGATGKSTVHNIGTDLAGNLYLQGSFSNSFSWGSISFTATVAGTAQSTTYWAKLSNTGAALAGFNLPQASPNNSPGNMVVDKAGNSYLANNFSTAINMGGLVLDPFWSNNIYIAKYNPTGVLQWANQIEISDSAGSFQQTSLAIDRQGKVYLAGAAAGQFTVDAYVVPGALTNSTVFMAAFDVYTGFALWQPQRSQGAANAGNTNVASSENGHIVLSGDFTDGQLFFDSTSTHPAAPATLSSVYVARFLQNYNLITGTVFLDTNGNNNFDFGEAPFSTPVVIQVSPNGSEFTSNAAGVYYAQTGSGTFSVSIPNAPLYYTASQVQSGAVSFTGLGNTSGNFHFAMQPIANQQDLQVFVKPLMPVRPGFTTTYRVTYRNVGTVAIPSGTVSLTFDPQLTHLSSWPAGSINANTLTWAYSNLEPNQTRNINVILSVPTTATPGDSVNFIASVTPLSGDLTPADNTESIWPVITASFDPNKIEVDKEALTPQQVQDGQWLYYTIHFQNMGTDTAFTVMLRDSLDPAMLKLNTIQLVAASHNHVWSLGPSGMMTVTYNNILLPHKGINSIGSHGFVRFRVKPQPGLAVGDIIPNQAKIYFDYNPYIATNVASTEVKLITGREEEQKGEWQIYPNPAHDKLTVASASFKGDAELTLLNVLGQQVLKNRASAANGLFRHELTLHNLPNGMYVLKLKTDAGVASWSVVKQ